MAQLFKLVFTLILIKLVLNPLLSLAAYDPALGLNDICEARCDHHRSRGWTGPFNFDCDDFSTEEEWDDCRNDCKECPKSVCNDADDQNSYRCPETQITGECKLFCDQNRKNGTTGSYVLNCLRMFDNPEDVQNCHRLCYTCPNYICDYLDRKTVFYCPGKGQDPPTKKPRTPRTKTKPTTTTTSTIIRTSTTIISSTTTPAPIEIIPAEVDKEPTSTRRPSMNIEGRSLEESNSTTETEQQDEDNLAPVSKISWNLTKLTYEGPCKARCDKFRLGGTKEYDFKCDDLFETDEEREKCKLDCLQCPRKICPRKLNYVFICPKSPDHVDPTELGPLGLVFLITTIILSFVCVTIGAFYWCRRPYHGRLVSEDVTTSGHQIEYLHQVPQQRQKQRGNGQAPMKIVSSDSMI